MAVAGAAAASPPRQQGTGHAHAQGHRHGLHCGNTAACLVDASQDAAGLAVVVAVQLVCCVAVESFFRRSRALPFLEVGCMHIVKVLFM